MAAASRVNKKAGESDSLARTSASLLFQEPIV